MKITKNILNKIIREILEEMKASSCSSISVMESKEYNPLKEADQLIERAANLIAKFHHEQGDTRKDTILAIEDRLNNLGHGDKLRNILDDIELEKPFKKI